MASKKAFRKLSLKESIQIFLLLILTLGGIYSNWWMRSEWIFLPVIMIMGIVALNEWKIKYLAKILFPVGVYFLIANPQLRMLISHWEGFINIGLFLFILTPFIYAYLLARYWTWPSPFMAKVFLGAFVMVMLSGLLYSTVVDNCIFGISKAEKGVSTESIRFCEFLDLYEPSMHMSKEGLIRNPGILARFILWLYFFYAIILYFFSIEVELDKTLNSLQKSEFTKRRIK